MPWTEEAAAAAPRVSVDRLEQAILDGQLETSASPSTFAPGSAKMARFPGLIVFFLLTALFLACLFRPASCAMAQQLPAIPAAPLPRAFPAPSLPPVQPRFIVVLDAAHGGMDVGARLGGTLAEKDLVLALSVRLRSMLSARGITVTTTRESDASLTPLTRAETANHAAGAACISLHATATGTGIHLFTSSLGATAPNRFLPWASAQSAYITQSLRLSSEINSAMAHAQVPVSLGRTSMQPLDSFACPAVALEIAPLAKPGVAALALTDAGYQARIVDALAAAIQQWRDDWRQQP